MKRTPIVVCLMFFLALATVVYAPALSKGDYLKYVGKEVYFDHACSEYQICNPTSIAFTPIAKNTANFNWIFTSAKGTLKDSWFEIGINNTYNRTVWIPNLTCSKVWNSTAGENQDVCIDTGKNANETYRFLEYSRFNPIGYTFAKNSCYNVKICGAYDLDKNRSVAIDNVLEIAGYNFKEFDWWNATFGYRYQIINNDSTARVIAVNGTFGIKNYVYWALTNNESYVYSESSGYGGLIDIANQTAQKYWENSTSRAGNNVSGLWTELYNASLVFHLDENVGTSLNDSSGKNNKGTFSGSPTWNSTCKFGYCVRFTTNVITVADDNSLDFKNKFTFLAWIKSDTIDATGQIVYHKDDVYNAQINANKWHAFVKIGGAAKEGDGNTTIAANTWYHVAVTFDGSYIRGYINGKAEGNQFPVAASGSIDASANGLFIGRHAASVLPFRGVIDEPRFYWYVMSDDEILQDYYVGVNNYTRLGAAEEPPVSGFINWKSNQTSIVTTYSSSVKSTFNITWNSSDSNGYNVSLFVSNYSGGEVNYSTTRVVNNSNYEAIIPSGYFYYYFLANNSANGYNKTSVWNATVNKITSACSMTVAPATPIGYETSSNASCSENNPEGSGNLYRNGTLANTENNVWMTLGAAVYNYTCNSTTTRNYSSCSNSSIYTITKFNANVQVYPATQSYAYGNITLQYCSKSSSLNCSLWRNGTSVTNGTSSLFAAGVYSFFSNISDSVNYTNWNDTETLTITQAAPNASVIFNTSSPAIIGAVINISCWYPQELISAGLWNDTGKIGTWNYSDPPYIWNTAGLSFGIYNFTCERALGSVNYTNFTTTSSMELGSSGALIIRAYDEITNSSLVFNITTTNDTYTDTKTNQNVYNNAIIHGYVTVSILSEGYPERVYYLTVPEDSTTSLNAYLLSSASGQYVSFYILNYMGLPLENSLIQLRRQFGSEWNIIGEKTTDSSGIGALFLDYSELYWLSIKYAGTWYLTNSSLVPTQTLYRYYINPFNTSNYTTEFSNLNIYISPELTGLDKSQTAQAISCMITSSDSMLQYFGLNLTLPNGVSYFTNNSASASGGTVSKTLNLTDFWVNNQTNISFDCFFKKLTFNQTDFYRNYFLYDLSQTNLTGLEKAVGEAKRLGFSVLALGIITLVLSGILGGFIGRFNAVGGGLVCIIMLGFLWYYLGLFAVATLQMTGIYTLVVITTACVIYLRGGI